MFHLPRRAARRGKLLTAFLAADTIGIVLLLLNLANWTSNPHILDGLYLQAAPDVIIAYRAIDIVISTAILIGMIRWKKLAVYGFFLTWMAGLILSATFLAVDPTHLPPPPTPAPPALLVYMAANTVVAVVAILAIRRKWANFT
jgi:hypothetical protein